MSSPDEHSIQVWTLAELLANLVAVHGFGPLSNRFSVFPVSTREFPESVKVKVSGPIVDFIRDIRTSETVARNMIRIPVKACRVILKRLWREGFDLLKKTGCVSESHVIACALDGFPPFVPVVVIGMVKR